MKKRVYLDASASHPVRASAKRAFQKALKYYGNPSAPHTEGREALHILEDARTKIARECGAKPDAVVFTAGATESNALAIVGFVKARIHDGAWPEDIRVLYSPTQHASVMGAVKEAEKLGATIVPLPLSQGDIDWGKLTLTLHEGVSLITLDVVCGETGLRFDTRRVRNLIDELPVSNRPVFHVDATQAVLTENMERTRLGADLISFDAQKIGGVRGIGALIAPRHIALHPITEGGGQERGLRSGTPSPALAVAFSTALTEVSKKRASFSKRMTKLRAYLKQECLALPKVVVNEGKEHAPNILNISVLGRDTDYLSALLDEAGFAVSTKSACESDASGSRVVEALTGDALRAKSTLRISLHEGVQEKDLRAFVTALKTAVKFIDEN